MNREEFPVAATWGGLCPLAASVSLRTTRNERRTAGELPGTRGVCPGEHRGRGARDREGTRFSHGGCDWLPWTHFFLFMDQTFFLLLAQVLGLLREGNKELGPRKSGKGKFKLNRLGCFLACVICVPAWFGLVAFFWTMCKIHMLPWNPYFNWYKKSSFVLITKPFAEKRIWTKSYRLNKGRELEWQGGFLIDNNKLREDPFFCQFPLVQLEV